MMSGAPVDVGLWYERYFPMVFRRCRNLLRDEEETRDAAQDVFERALPAVVKKRLRADYPSSLLYTIATRVCLNRLRDKKRRRASRPAASCKSFFVTSMIPSAPYNQCSRCIAAAEAVTPV